MRPPKTLPPRCRRNLRSSAPALLFALVACGDANDCPSCALPDSGSPCADDSRADTYVAGLEKTSASGWRYRLVDSLPSPPAKGDNRWVIEVTDDTETLAQDLSLQIVPFMPDHGHGTPIQSTITEPSPGRYEVDPINLWMPGLWQVHVGTLDQPDQVVFGFCIRG